jgi:soluble lytic murein transglycosylase-like protein
VKALLVLLVMFPSIALATCPAKRIVEAIAIEHEIDPKLALAIMKVESNCNDSKVGTLGEVGIFQLRPNMHTDAHDRGAKHITSAIRYLRYVHTRCYRDYGPAWFICYNQGPFRKTKLKEPTKNSYYQKVMEAYGENEDPSQR